MLPDAGSTAATGAGACPVGAGDLGVGAATLTVGCGAGVGVGAGLGADLGGDGRGLKVLWRGALLLVALAVPAGRAGGDGMVTWRADLILGGTPRLGKVEP
jgi:hypothetical protein